MTTAFVLSGGAALGAAQAGMLFALAEAGIAPDLIVGTSVGAVNGAWLAGATDAADMHALTDLWRSIDRDDVFPRDPMTGLLGFLGRRQHLVPDRGLRHLVSSNVRFERLEDAPIPLHVVVTDVLSGEDVCLHTGDTVDAVVASASIPAVLPPVQIGDRCYMDGGVVNNTPISHAVDAGADTVWVLSTGYSCALPEPPRGALAMALHALTLTVNQRLAVDVAHYERAIDLRVVPPLCPIRTTPADFSASDDLIARAHAATTEWLHSMQPRLNQAALLRPHRH
jgi:NTE family protein